MLQASWGRSGKQQQEPTSIISGPSTSKGGQVMIVAALHKRKSKLPLNNWYASGLELNFGLWVIPEVPLFSPMLLPTLGTNALIHYLGGSKYARPQNALVNFQCIAHSKNFSECTNESNTRLSRWGGLKLKSAKKLLCNQPSEPKWYLSAGCNSSVHALLTWKAISWRLFLVMKMRQKRQKSNNMVALDKV